MVVIKSEVVEKIPRDKKVILGSIAGMIATTLFHPLDMIKVRMQVYDLPKSSLEMAKNICKCEGFKTLYVGLTAGLMRQATYTATRLAVYYWLYDQYKQNYSNEPNLNYKVIFGIYAGLAGAFIGNPSEVALVRLMGDRQKDPCGPCPKTKRYRGVTHAIYKIVRNEGIFTLWRGGVLTLARSVFLTTAQIGTYAEVREVLHERNVAKGLQLHLYTSTISSFLAALVSLPADVIKTKYQVRSDKLTQWQTVVQLHKNRGIRYFWKGFFPYFIRMALHTFASFYLMEIMCTMYRDHVMEKKDQEK